MKSCLNCQYADWRRTDKGRLHSSGEGRCTYQYKVPELPQAMYWSGPGAPKPYGGFIDRRKELKDHCAYFQRIEV